MLETGKDYKIDNMLIYENSLFVLGKSIDKHAKTGDLAFILFDNGKCIFDKRDINSSKERFAIKEQFNEFLRDKRIDIENPKCVNKLALAKVQLGVSQKRYGIDLGKKRLDADIVGQDLHNLIKYLKEFSETQKKLVLVTVHLSQYQKDLQTIDDPHCHILYSKFTPFEENALKDFLINK